jgi:hypothetical protein
MQRFLMALLLASVATLFVQTAVAAPSNAQKKVAAKHHHSKKNKKTAKSA